MDKDQKARIFNPKKSLSAKMAWKRNRPHYNKEKKKKEREFTNMENSQSLINDLRKAIKEANVDNINSFDLHASIDFDNIPGGLDYRIDPENNQFSLSFKLSEKQAENDYRFENELAEEDYKNTFNSIGDELLKLCNSFDESLNGILVKNGLLKDN